MVGPSFSYFSCLVLSAACCAVSSRCLPANSVRRASVTAFACGASCISLVALTTPILISALAGAIAAILINAPAAETIHEHFTALLPEKGGHCAPPDG